MYRYVPSSTVTYRYLPSPTVTYRCLPLQVMLAEAEAAEAAAAVQQTAEGEKVHALRGVVGGGVVGVVR